MSLTDLAARRKQERLGVLQPPISTPPVAQRLNPRSAEVQNANQAATRAEGLGGVVTTQGNQAAVDQSLGNVAAGNVNQAGERSVQNQAQTAEIQGNLQTQQVGAGGQAGALGFNPAGQIQSNPNQPGNYSVSSQLQQRLAAIEQEEQQKGTAGYASPEAAQEAYNKKREQARADVTTQGQAAQIDQQNAEHKANQSAASSAASAQAAQKSSSPALAAALAALPPELQFFGQAISEALSGLAQSQQENQSAFGVMTQNLNGVEKAITKTVQDAQTTQKLTANAVEGMLKDVRDRNEKYITAQETAAKERLAWNELQQTRDIKKNERQALDAKIAQLALTGRSMSDSGVAELDETHARFENALSDLQSEMGMQRTDLAAKFTGLYIQAENAYQSESVKNMQELAQSLEGLSFQGLASQTAVVNAKNAALEKFVSNQATYRKDASNMILDANMMVVDLLGKERAAKAEAAKAEADREWDMYKLNFDKDLELMKFGLSQQEKDENQQIRLDDQALRRMDQNRNSLGAAISRDKVIQDADQVNGYYGGVLTAVDQATRVGKGDKKSFNSVDNLLVSSFMKMTDPGSVVRESEFARIPDNMSAIERMRATWGRVATGGILTPGERDEIKNTAAALNESWQKLLGEREERYLLQLDGYNNSVGEQYMLTPEEFGLSNHMTSLDRQDLDDYLPDGYQSPHSSGNPFSGGGDGSVGSAVVSMGRVTQSYDTKLDPSIYPASVINAWNGTHRGLDVAIPQGTALPSLVEGEVVEVGYNGGWGGTVVIEDKNGAQHRLSHLSDFAVEKGAKIRAGQLIGHSGGGKGTKGAGNSTGAHLDYRIRVNGQYVDPMKYVSSQS